MNNLTQTNNLAANIALNTAINSYHKDKCPECGKPEDIKEVCRHCEYEYPEDYDISWWGITIIILLICFSGYLFGTVIYWLTDYNNSTLIEIFHGQIDWISNKRLW